MPTVFHICKNAQINKHVSELSKNNPHMQKIVNFVDCSEHWRTVYNSGESIYVTPPYVKSRYKWQKCWKEVIINILIHITCLSKVDCNVMNIYLDPAGFSDKLALGNMDHIT